MNHTCTKCLVEKPLTSDYFHKDPSSSTGFRKRCKTCAIAVQMAYEQTPAGRSANRRARLKMRYGITQNQYDWLLDQQDHKCYLCDEPETLMHHATGMLRALAVDHDHRCCPGNKACGRCVRGLLCYNCNRFMGRVDNSPRLSLRFKDYQDRRPLNPHCPECLSASTYVYDYIQPYFECSRGHKWPPPLVLTAEVIPHLD